MKALWILVIAAAPLATLTAWGLLDTSAAGTVATVDALDTQPAAMLIQKQSASVKAQKEVVTALIGVDLLSLKDLPGLEDLQSDSLLGPLRRTWPMWTTARELVDEFLGLAASDAMHDLEQIQAVKRRWESLQQRLEAAKLPASSTLTPFVGQRLAGLQRQVARLEAQTEALAAAKAIQSDFAAQRYDECLARSREWLTKHNCAAPAALAEEIKALGLRAEFHMERERSRARLKAAALSAERETLLAAFLERFPSTGSLVDSERAVLEQCRRYLEALRAEAAAQDRLRAANEAIRVGMADLPARFDERLARAVRILEKHPTASVKSTLRGRVREWLMEFLPEKTADEPTELREAETKDGRVLRGYFREISGPDGTVGYKRYDTPAQRQNPTADVGTWPSQELASPPGPTLSQRLVEQYGGARGKLLAQPERRELWEAFAGLCERLQTQCEEYRAKPGAADEIPSFRAEAQFARQVPATSSLQGLDKIFGESKEP